mgnify:FL=1|jgi:hypothetical protein
MRLTIIALLALLPLAASAEEPWGKVDLKSAKPLHDKACVSCHVRMYGGDGSKMYTRDGRLLSTKLDVLQRVASCNAMVSSGWFPEEEASVAAWLNQQYYHFKK